MASAPASHNNFAAAISFFATAPFGGSSSTLTKKSLPGLSLIAFNLADNRGKAPMLASPVCDCFVEREIVPMSFGSFF